MEVFKSVVGSQPAPPTLSAFAAPTGRRHCEWHSVKCYQHFLPHVAELEPSEILALLLFPQWHKQKSGNAICFSGVSDLATT